MALRVLLRDNLQLRGPRFGCGPGGAATLDKFPRSVLTRLDYGAERHMLTKGVDLAIAQAPELGVPM
jgi:hypothetical protein